MFPDFHPPPPRPNTDYIPNSPASFYHSDLYPINYGILLPAYSPVHHLLWNFPLLHYPPPGPHLRSVYGGKQWRRQGCAPLWFFFGFCCCCLLVSSAMSAVGHSHDNTPTPLWILKKKCRSPPPPPPAERLFQGWRKKISFAPILPP